MKPGARPVQQAKSSLKNMRGQYKAKGESLLLQPKLDPFRTMARIRQQMVQGAQTHTFRELDPAMSDLLSEELEAAVDRLMEMATEQIDQGLQARKKKTERGS